MRVQLRRRGILGVGISYLEVEDVEKSREDCDILMLERVEREGERVVSKAACARAYIIGWWVAPLEPARSSVVTAQGFNYPKYQVVGPGLGGERGSYRANTLYL